MLVMDAVCSVMRERERDSMFVIQLRLITKYTNINCKCHSKITLMVTAVAVRYMIIASFLK